MFFIERLDVITASGEISRVHFVNGLNIICGESNTGKTMIMNCIDYLCGGKEDNFDPNIKIAEISLYLLVDEKRVSMTREIGSNEIYVTSDCDYINSGMYKVSHNSEHSINDVWLRILGISEPVEIIRTLDGKTQRLTLRTFLHTLLIDETRIKGPASILAAGHGKNTKADTPILTSLLYLATENNYLPEEEIIDPKIKKVKMTTVKTFVDRSIESFKNISADELKGISSEKPADIQKKIDQTINEIGAVEGELEKAVAESQKLADRIQEIEDNITENKILFSRNKSLKSQYESDIRRLTFIVDGDINYKSIPTLEYCPFCNGKITNIQNESCLSAANEEVNKIENQLKDLNSVQEAIIKEINVFKDEKTDLIEKRKEIDNQVRLKLKPQINQLRKILADYTLSLNTNKAKEMIESLSDVLVSEMNATFVEMPADFKFNAKAKFGEVFTEEINTALNEIIRQINQAEFSKVYFDIDECDVVISGHKKKTQGEGYRAFYNTIMAVAFQNVLKKFNKHVPGFLILDSPILSLKESSDNDAERMSENMKYMLFKYFVEHSADRQTIIIENTIPNMDYENVNIIHFTADEKIGRYGFINNYRNNTAF